MSRKFKLEFNNELSKSFAYLLANVNTPEKAVMDAAARTIGYIVSRIEATVNAMEVVK